MENPWAIGNTSVWQVSGRDGALRCPRRVQRRNGDAPVGELIDALSQAKKKHCGSKKRRTTVINYDLAPVRPFETPEHWAWLPLYSIKDANGERLIRIRKFKKRGAEFLVVNSDGTEQPVPKMNAWNRVYSIKRRLEIEIQEYFNEWMTEVSDDCSYQVNEQQFAQLITSAKVKAKERATRRMEPKQIVKEAFYDFVLTKAKGPFVESFRRLRNEPYA